NSRASNNNNSATLAYIAIDNFRSMKSQVGIAGADLLLGDLANLLKEQAGDDLTLARMSDDAFSVMCMPCDEKTLAERSERIRKAVEDCLFDINGRTLPLTVSIGVAAITENSPKAEELLARAHTASFDVRKKEGHEQGNGVLIYNPADYESLDDTNSIEAIQKALDENRFRLLFQPIINLRGEGEEHYEASVRMLDKD